MHRHDIYFPRFWFVVSLRSGDLHQNFCRVQNLPMGRLPGERAGKP